ncbi:methionine--tRNA ligase [Symbiobacterium thermophilum]|uniref:Methionine--tRNA ligase n=1 Tax=Symbiobacterium thermophilum (strain DSM 24528 / JCM 14929 / IAM 14863 / T) TaxID=292459 RepID=Q67JB6_SYMTH|nr:methionine--tRNA ligase [Symbiobacterium thermophilum]BAD42234.1 methionyl-tRNA synthetase [Symbiobacterium thermophilum IAM 14863]
MTRFYITTPIYYPSSKLHIGHSYTTVAADALARYHRRLGHETYFLTGTDEHGQKIERAALAEGKTPIQFVDEIVAGIKELWAALHISYDDFIRTTEERHKKVVQKIFKQLYDQGDIYKSSYEGWYCTPCETFWIESKLKEGNLCPDCGRPVEWTKDESYFFRLSKYADRLLRYIEETDFIQPASRKNEMISFINQGLEDLCVSRSTVRWGIPVPFDEKQTIYVWIDALSNYISALGWGTENDELYRKFWPADVHLVGKEIVRFHTIIWPCILMALGLPLPKKVFGHGWLLFGTQAEKMSKSKGNVVDPFVLIDRYGVDAVRYYLLREVPFGADGTYTEEAFILRTNNDLANDLGNLLSRTTQMINKFSDGRVPEPDPASDDRILSDLAAQVLREFQEAMDRLEISSALVALWKLVDRANKYIDEQAPWALARDPGRAGQLRTVLYNLAETLRLLGVALTPFLVQTPERIWDQLGLEPAQVRTLPWEEAVAWGGLKPGTVIRRGSPLFPRIELPKENGDSVAKEGKAQSGEPAAGAAQPTEGVAEIEYDDFAKVELKVAEVVEAERIPKADRLLRLVLQVGEERRQIVSGIAQHYAPEELVGKRIILVANLKPKKLRGVESHGMLLAATAEDGSLSLVTLDKPDFPTGMRVK